MRYEVNGGRILTWSLEAHLADHCNLRCAECCTSSPHLPPRVADPDALARDLSLAARAVAPQMLKLTGGEPLLHPELARCLVGARQSGIAPRLSLTTNGHLVHRVPDAALALLDRVCVSLYPSAPLPESRLGALAERCERLGVELRLKWADRFGRMDRPRPSPAAAARVHADCWLKQRCHLVYEGRFYACTRPPHLEQRLRARGSPVRLAEADGVDLEGPDLRQRILALLEAQEPYASCAHCLGSGGGWIPQRQLPRARVARAPA